MRALQILVVILLLFPPTLLAQDNDSKSSAALRAQNPLSNIITLPLQNNTTFGYGEYDKTANVLNIQPVYIAKMGKKEWLSITRFIIPFPTTVPDLSSENGGSKTGLGDINYTTWIAPPSSTDFRFGFGYVSIWPTATGQIWGSDKFSLGPSFVFVCDKPKYILGAIVSQWWSISGDKNAAAVSVFSSQYFITYLLKTSWYLTSAPIITSNWEAEKGQQWTVPFGGGGGKMFSIGKLPVDFQLQAFYYAVSPDWGPTWELRTQLKFIFPGGEKKSR